MVKIYIPRCDGYDCPDELYAAFERAKVWFRINRIAMTMHIMSRNTNAPLTLKEKEELCDMLVNNHCPYAPIF